MSENENSQSEEIITESLVEEVSDYVSTDTITDLKSGIYNLYLSLLNHMTAVHGPVQAVILSTQFLDNISNTFKETIEPDGDK
jgi:hypothetical protein